MKYDITKPSAPTMPTLGKGTECIQLLLSQTSKDMHDPLVPMLFPILGAHISGTEFQYPDLTWKAHYGQMDNPVTDTGSNKAQLSTLVGGPLSPLPSARRRGGTQKTRRMAKPDKGQERQQGETRPPKCGFQVPALLALPSQS